MSTVIRLKRGGRTHAPYYRVVVMDSRSRARGRELAQIGIYHPCARPEPKVEVDKKEALAWLIKGAQMTDTVRTVMKKNGVVEAYNAGMKPEDIAEEPRTEEAPAAETAPAAEAPAEEPKAEEPPAPEAVPAAEAAAEDQE